MIRENILQWMENPKEIRLQKLMNEVYFLRPWLVDNLILFE